MALCVCGTREEAPVHPCPFRVELCGADDTGCKCCAACTAHCHTDNEVCDIARCPEPAIRSKG